MQEIPVDRIMEMNRAKERIMKREGFYHASFVYIGLLAGGTIGTMLALGEEAAKSIIPFFPSIVVVIIVVTIMQLRDKALVNKIQAEVMDMIKGNSSE